MNHINVSKYIYYRQDDVRLAIAHQIESRVAINVGRPGQPHSGLTIANKQTNKQTDRQTNKQTKQTNKQTNKHKTSLNNANFRFSKKIYFQEEDRGVLVQK